MNFEEKWKLYLDCLQGHPTVAFISEMDEDKKNLIKNSLPVNDFKNLLDIGTANGQEAFDLQQLGYNVIGITRGKVNIAYSKEKFPSVNILNVDMHDLKFKKGRFDSVYMCHTFEHAFAPFLLLLEINYILRDKGRLLIITPSFVEGMTEITMISHHHPTLFYTEQYIAMFQSTGFNVINLDDSDSGGTIIFLLEKNNNDLHSDVKTLLINKELYDSRTGLSNKLWS